ncbi:fumarylacetoacetate hydrolase family protein [Halobacillus ihumii]|uniref:fumarylacetoacetate hydrolase family protein n=1 Tax=Halobacillus ihumii TaxID=2686092 RepID=UPI0013D05632|nr:fumarylacetoacetate hydrolase family protein [Halobacillus ihumii]
MYKAKAKLGGKLQAKEVEVRIEDTGVEVDDEELLVANHNWDAPVTGTIYGALLNYQGTMEAMKDELTKDPYKAPPKAPILYIKPQNTVIGHQMTIPLPDDVQELEAGACLGVVIGQKAARVKQAEALQYIAGYTIVNDISVPHESVFRPAVKHKARDGFCPAGPWVMERDAVPNPDQLGIEVRVNGEVQQRNNTKNLVRSVSKLLADVTEFMTLDEGDVLLVGIPENPPRVKAGDHIRIEIERVGALENVVSKRGNQV